MDLNTMLLGIILEAQEKLHKMERHYNAKVVRDTLYLKVDKRALIRALQNENMSEVQHNKEGLFNELV